MDEFWVCGRIAALIAYAEKKGLADPRDRVYYRNELIGMLGLDGYTETEAVTGLSLQTLLDDLSEYALRNGLIADAGVTAKDLFDTRLMGLFTPLPSVVEDLFAYTEAREGTEAATDLFYSICKDTNYIRAERVAKDLRWTYDGKYGVLDITVNLSKPEKDPKAIAAARSSAQTAYPKCQLCAENVGYHGRLDHPARENLRTIPMTLAGENWLFQYSPYVYYNEHCIVLNSEHVPMRITPKTFARQLDFVERFPHYFVGSNADLPIVGGSILTHDHFQGGRYTFAMERASALETFSVPGFEDLTVEWLNWPLSVLRATGSKARVAKFAERVLEAWRGYSDPDATVFAETDGVPHNTITPIARRKGDLYQLDLVLRNNLTTAEHPDGLYHPHREKHHIKKENIGLIEVMGLAVLPSRLKKELAAIEERFASGLPLDTEETAKHAEWFSQILARRTVNTENLHAVLLEEVGRVFESVLEDAGVFRPDETGKAGIEKFVGTL